MREEHFREVNRVLSAHASVAECARGGPEQMTVRRIVHIYVVLVGEAKLHNPEHITLARGLNKLIAADVHTRPINGVRIDFAAVDANPQTAPPPHHGAAPSSSA